jgi:septal ring factor EnvC (AmiA/AmiB activator)
MTTTDPQYLDDDAPDRVAMAPAAVEVRARMTRDWAAQHNSTWTVRQHLEGDVPSLLAEVERLRADNAELCEDLADLAQARAVLDATRRMANDANAALRAQLLAALAWDDDGRTPLSDYIAHLVAQRDALKAQVDAAHRFADAGPGRDMFGGPEIGASLRRVLDEAKPGEEVAS